jgi:thiol-disulfide isomerase/thioredoxin
MLNFKFYLLIFFVVYLNLNLIGQEQNPFLKEKLLVSYNLPNGSLDTLDFIKIINGTDKESSFINQNGDTINYSSFKNKVVLVDFWFLACPPCIVELSGLELLDKKVRSDDFVILTFANDSLADIDEKLLSKKAFDFSIVPNVYLVADQTYPLKLLVDKNAKIVDYKHGGNVGQNSIPRLLNKYLPLVKSATKK